MSDKEFMWALKNGDLDEVKDYVAKVGGGAGEGLRWARRRCGLRREEWHGALLGALRSEVGRMGLEGVTGGVAVTATRRGSDSS